ncbi:hypothetical protein LXA43DRAFT_1065403 [Ganoderma leucocontextum]|nr:hypothetical protein LXA43DRAFT_1065403 [Ganoderma leucocontextum]
MDPEEGLVEHVSPDQGNVAYFRFEKRMQPRGSTNPGVDEPAPNPVLMPYWVADKIGAILPLSPPNLSADPKLCLGDVFIFHTATQYRLWIWVQFEGRRFWKRVSEGYQCADGKCLLVTEVKREPSWVTKEHYERSSMNKLMAQIIAHGGA